MNQPKVSIVIPVYNNEKYIEQCLESVINQTLLEIEIICVNDESTDKSYEVMEKFAEKYDNIFLINQKNSGPGKARNKGIQLARGEYIAFLDGDDFYYKPDVLKKLYLKAIDNQVDICGGSVVNYRSGVFTSEGLRKGMVFQKEEKIQYINYPVYYGFWRFIYKRQFLIDNKILFPDYRRNQDPLFFVKAMLIAKEFYAIPDKCYCYRKEHKEEKFTVRKVIDNAKGMRDILLLAQQAGMAHLYTNILNSIHGELTAMIYKTIVEGNQEIEEIRDEINAHIDQSLIDITEFVWETPYLLSNEEIIDYVGNIDTRKRIFLNRVKEADGILVYGAGIIGKQVIRFLKNESLQNIEAVVVTSKEQNPEMVNGIKVLSIDEVKTFENKIVLVATFPYLHKEIEQNLIKRNVINYELINIEEFMLYEKEIIH